MRTSFNSVETGSIGNISLSFKFVAASKKKSFHISVMSHNTVQYIRNTMQSIKIRRCTFKIAGLVSSDSVTRVNDWIRVTILGDLDSTLVRLRKMVTWLESRFSQNDSTRVTINNSRLESESFLQNLWVPDGQPSSFTHKEMSIFCCSDDQDWRKFYVLPV